jgi:hypothetical protein
MANNISNVTNAGNILAKAAAGYLADNLQFVKSISKADASDFAGKNGYKSGSTVDINVPARFSATDGAALSVQDVEEAQIALTVDNQKHVDFAFTSEELATEMDIAKYAERVVKPAMITLGSAVEQSVLEQAVRATYNLVGTAGTTSFDTDTMLSAGQKLDENGCADYDNRFVLLNPAANRSAVNERKGLFQSSEEISKQYKSGAMGIADGFTFLRNNLLPTITTGTHAGTTLVKGASQTGASLIVDGFTAAAPVVKKGTVFTLAGVYAVNPVTKATLGDLQQFTVTADVTGASNEATLAISPAIVTSGSKQNVSAGPADNAAVVFVGANATTYGQNIAYHKDAFRFVSLPLIKPQGVDMVGQETVDGITVRLLRDYDIATDRMIMRADVLFGMAEVRPEWSSIIIS